MPHRQAQISEIQVVVTKAIPIYQGKCSHDYKRRFLYMFFFFSLLNIKFTPMFHDLGCEYMTGFKPLIFSYSLTFIYVPQKYILNQTICYSSCWVRAGLDCLSPLRCFFSCSPGITHTSPGSGHETGPTPSVRTSL